MPEAYSYTTTKDKTYYLHSRGVQLKNGRTQTIFFFALDVREGALFAVPDGYEVMETQRTGMPVLKKKP